MEDYRYWKRITKYNPCYRNEQGAYLRPEWTAISDVGKVFGNELVTWDDYRRVEACYVQAAQLLFAGSAQVTLGAFSLGWDEGPDQHAEPTLYHAWQSLREEVILPSHDVEHVVKLFLRKHAQGCVLDRTQRIKLEFGYDYYMYVNYEQIPNKTFMCIESLGLFVE